MSASPMRRLAKLGPVSFFWAEPGVHTYPGVVVWLGARFARWHSRLRPERGGHLRLLPVPRPKT